MIRTNYPEVVCNYLVDIITYADYLKKENPKGVTYFISNMKEKHLNYLSGKWRTPKYLKKHHLIGLILWLNTYE